MPEVPSLETRSARWPFLAAGWTLVAIAALCNEWMLGAWLTVFGRITNPASRLVLAAIDMTALAAGLTLLLKRDRAPWRQMLLAVAASGLALIAAEGGLRAFFGVRAWLEPPDRRLAATIGWRPVANFSSDRDLPGFGRVRYSTQRDGFRVWGNPAGSGLKIFVLGDSFTEAATVSDGEAYYEQLGRSRPSLEVFAIGGGGYGTLQEYMLLDEFIDRIRPGLVLLQMHPNDLINNSHALESRSATDNNQMTRPYWEDGRIVSRFPENAAFGPFYNLVRHSYLLRLVNVNLSFLRPGVTSSIEKTAGRDDPDVIRAVETTVELLEKIRERSGVPVAAFSAKPDDAFPFWSPSEACRRAGVEFIPGVGEAVEAAIAAGEPVTGLPVDAHWNARGHAIAAGVIGAWLDVRTNR